MMMMMMMTVMMVMMVVMMRTMISSTLCQSLGRGLRTEEEVWTGL